MKKIVIGISILSALVIALIILFWGRLSLPSGPKPQLLSVSPSFGEQEVSLLPEITLTFDQKVSLDQISASSNPSISFENLTKEPSKVLKYRPEKLLQKQTNYQITIKFKFGGEYSWSFTTSVSEAGAVPGWAENFERAEKEYLKTHPPGEVEIINALVKKMPYFDDGFWIEYSFRFDTYTVHLCQEPLEQTRKKVEDWFNQQGLNKVVVMKKPKIEWLYGCEPPVHE